MALLDEIYEASVTPSVLLWTEEWFAFRIVFEKQSSKMRFTVSYSIGINYRG